MHLLKHACESQENHVWKDDFKISTLIIKVVYRGRSVKCYISRH